MHRQHKALVLTALGLGLLLTQTGLQAGGPKKGGVQIGDKAPQFQAKDDQGKTWKSTAHVGKNYLVVFFFPAALTGG